jgi:hypothetical protein
MKVVVNKCYGGFGLSNEALDRLHELGFEGIATPIDEHFQVPDDTDEFHTKYGKAATLRANKAFRETGEFPGGGGLVDTLLSKDFKYVLWSGRLEDKQRSDPRLVALVEELGKRVNGDFANLEIVEIPDGTDYVIAEYDGFEHVEEVHRSWH